MKKTVCTIALCIQALSASAQSGANRELEKLIAKQFPEYPKIIQSSVTMQKYVAARKSGGEYVTANEWYGWVIIAKPDESQCLRVARENFRLNQLDGLQLPAYSGTQIPVGCPQTAIAANNTSANR